MIRRTLGTVGSYGKKINVSTFSLNRPCTLLTRNNLPSSSLSSSLFIINSSSKFTVFSLSSSQSVRSFSFLSSYVTYGTTTTTTPSSVPSSSVTDPSPVPPNADTPLLNATVNLIEKLNKDLPLLSSSSSSTTPSTLSPSSSIVSNGNYPDFSITTATLDTETGLRGITWDVIQWLHNIGGMEYWAAIAMASLGLRFAVLPLFIKAVKTGAWLQHHNEAVMQFSQQMAQAQEKKNVEELRRIFADRKNFMAKHGLQMRWVILPSLIQLPIFIAFFGTLRTMAKEAHLLPGMLEGGTAWFPLLYLPDPTGALPVLSAVLSALAIRINNNMQGIPQLDLTPGGQKLVFAGLSVIFNLFTLSLPAAVQIYIAMTSGTMVIQQGLLRIPFLRHLMGFPSDWPIPSHIFAERAKKRAVVGDNVNPVVSNMRNFQPFFRRASEIAAGNYRAAPKQEYVTLTGLKDPGIPLPPPSLVVGSGNSSSSSNGTNTLSNNTTNNVSSTASVGKTVVTPSSSSSTVSPTPVYTTQRIPKKKNK